MVLYLGMLLKERELVCRFLCLGVVGGLELLILAGLRLSN